MVRYQLPEDWFDTYADKGAGLRPHRTWPLRPSACFAPDQLVWVVVGDRAKIESGIRELNLGELRLIDADGNPVK